MRLKALLFVLGSLPGFAAFAAPDPTILALRQEIAALRIDHALNLTRDQAVALLPILRDAASQAKARRDAFERAKPALVAALTQARDELRSSGSISDSTRQALSAARGSWKGDAPRLRTQLGQILTPDQLAALRAMRPGAAQAQPGDGATGGRARGRHGLARRFLAYRALTSEPFLALVQSRAG
jgi:hypothetical protein